MGFFSDPCGICATPIKKSRRFCPECGAPGPNADFTCPHCAKPNKGIAKICASCGKALLDSRGRPIERAFLYEKTWVREPDDFAVRLHVQDVQGRFSKWVVLEEGTSALVFQDGRYVGNLAPGRHNHTSLSQRFLSAFNLATPAVFVLIEIADVELEILNECVTSEGLPVGVTAKIVVALRDPLRFFQNLMKGRTALRRGDLERSLEREVETAVQSEIRHTALRELTGNLKLRENIIGTLAKHLSMTLARYGLDLIHVSSLTFESEDLKRIIGRDRESFELRDKGAAAIKAAEAEAARIRGVDAVAQAQSDIALRDEQRRQQLERARRQDDLAGAQHAVNKRAVSDDYARESGKKDQEAQLDVLNRKREADLKNWQAQQEADLAIKQKKLAMYSAAPPQALAGILDGPEFDRLMKVEDLRAQEKLSPEQMLIFVAGKSPDVAQALAQKYIADGSLKMAQAEKIFAEQKAAMAQQMSEHAVDRIADVAEGRAKAAGSINCPACGRAVMAQYSFCPFCQAKLKS